ncbi:MAG: porin [Prevotellaceae bacterium]|nr:OprO/OprP family phosphate-selective porin [Prevotella sp.]MDD7257816.1 porin [Prevotellaceae bacterium]MDY6130064.1 porin [Prevotella sp.]
MRRILLSVVVLASVAANAQEKKEVFSKPQFSGYILGLYTAKFQEENNTNDFSIRMIRVIAKGKILNEFEYTLQGQVNGTTKTWGGSPRVVDANVEWQKYDFFRVKIGQFKRPFTYENPMHPIDVGFSGLAQVIMNLSGFTDRSGEHASNGRDIGLQFQGDFAKNAEGRNLLHYQVGIFNGQGINTGDVNNQKDIIGGVWYMPVKGVRIGAFGWEGSHARRDNNGKVVSLPQHRYALSAEYNQEDWQLRSEYIHSTGYGFKNSAGTGSPETTEVNMEKGDEADGFYVVGIAPLVKGKLRAKARYDVYRQSGEWSTAKTMYEAGLNYIVHKNFELQFQYSFVNDKTLPKHNYGMFNTQVCVRF